MLPENAEKVLVDRSYAVEHFWEKLANSHIVENFNVRGWNLVKKVSADFFAHSH